MILGSTIFQQDFGLCIQIEAEAPIGYAGRMNPFARISIPFLLLISLASCGVTYPNYGVLLWNSAEAGLAQGQAPGAEVIATGDLVGISSESQIQNVYRLGSLDGQSYSNLEVPRWLVRKFGTLAEAEAWAAGYAEWVQHVGVAATQNLPVRSEPTSTANQVYRIRNGERVKVLFRQPEKTVVGNLEDYWYQVLTSSGITGWVFGYYLGIEIGDKSITAAGTTGVDDPLLGQIFQRVWRPENYLTMIRSRQIDPEIFSSTYGLFADAENKVLTLVMPGERKTFTYKGVFSPRYGQYLFEESDAQIVFLTDERLSFQYIADGKSVSRNLVVIRENIDALVQQELQRREALMSRLTRGGAILRSTSYGTLEVFADGAFRWTDFSRAPVLPAGFSGAGTLSFNVFVAPELQETYPDGLSLRPQGGATWAPVNFLAELTQSGLRLEYVSAVNVQENVVRRREASPFIMFFEYQSE